MYTFEDSKRFLYSDTQVPDIFISEYLPEMTGLQVKIYLYCLFLSKNKKKINELLFAKTFGLTEEEVIELFEEFIKKGLFIRKGKGYLLADLKDLEINKLYKPRTTASENELEKKSGILSTINKSFFQGIMPISWYTNIEMWFNLYKFEDDVMYALFNYCSERGLLKYSYINAVAKNWAEAGIRNSFDLDEYFIRYKKTKEISSAVARKLKRKAPFTEYEESYIKKWVQDYKYGMDIIELALKNAVKISNPNLQYFHKILTEWNKKGYRTKAQVEEAAKNYKSTKPGEVIDDLMLKRKIKEYYDNVKEKNKSVMKNRELQVFEKAPEIRKLQSDISNLSIDSLSMRKEDREAVFTKIDEMKNLVSKTLINHGFPIDYLEPVYDCEKCSDTGVLADGSSCTCRKELIERIKSI
jgi:DnaD/phage-associated family protein